MMKQSNAQSGNILWFILLAVALLGFLTMVLSRTGSQVEQSGNIEQARVKAAALLRYTKSIETAVAEMLSRGVSENSLDFSAIHASYNNPSCTDTSCAVFETQGGGITYRTPAEVLGDPGFNNAWVVSTGNRIGGMGCDDATHECRDLVLLLGGIPDTLCMQINAIMGIANPTNAPPTQQYIEEGTPFTGAYDANAQNRLLGGSAADESPQVKGKNAGCVRMTVGGSTNYAFQVLVAR